MSLYPQVLGGVGFWAFLVVVLPTALMLSLTQGLRGREPVRGWIISLLPSIALLYGALWIANSSRDGGPSGGAPEPVFHWPPPSPSARLVIPRDAFTRSKTFGQVSSYLESALTKAGYTEMSYYSVPGGIAVVTRLEEIHRDGTPFPEPERWPSSNMRWQVLSLAQYVQMLLGVYEGYYRVVVFTVTDQAFESANMSVTSDEANRWLTNGYNTLPVYLAQQPISPAHECTALIYEFQKSHGEPAGLVRPSDVGAKQHLLASGLLAGLLVNAAGGVSQ